MLFATLFAQGNILTVRNFIVIQLTEQQLHSAVGHIVQKCPVVGDNHYRAVILFQIALQPLNTLDIEVVGRLIEQDNRRTAQQQLGKFNTHTPTATKFTCRPAEVLTAEAKTEQCALNIGIAVVTTEDIVTVGSIVQTVQKCLILSRVIVIALSNLSSQARNLSLQLQHLLKGLSSLLGKGCGIGHRHLLWQVAESCIGRASHHTRSGGLLSHYNFQQSGLARAIFTHQTNAVLGVYEQ